MLHFVLFGLKILGIILLVILGLILLALLLILLVPVRYRADGTVSDPAVASDEETASVGETTSDGEAAGNSERASGPETAADPGKKNVAGTAEVSWLLRLIRARIVYDGSLAATVRVFGFSLFDETLIGDKDDSEDENGREAGEQSEREKQPEAETKPGRADRPQTENPPGADKRPDTGDLDDDLSGILEEAEPELSAQEIAPAGRAEEVRGGPAGRAGENTVTGGPDIPAGSDSGRADSAGENTATGPDISDDAKPEDPPSKLSGLTEKIRSICRSACDRYRSAGEKLQSGRKLYGEISEFLSDEGNRGLIALLWRQTKKLIRHILPRKIAGRLRFGFDDPYTTGQILTAVSPFYPLYAKTFSFEPVFDGKALDGEFHIKGHIRVVTLLWIAVRVLLNRNLWKLIKKWRNR